MSTFSWDIRKKKPHNKWIKNDQNTWLINQVNKKKRIAQNVFMLILKKKKRKKYILKRFCWYKYWDMQANNDYDM